MWRSNTFNSNLKCIQNSDDRELLSFALTAVNLLSCKSKKWTFEISVTFYKNIQKSATKRELLKSQWHFWKFWSLATFFSDFLKNSWRSKKLRLPPWPGNWSCKVRIHHIHYSLAVPRNFWCNEFHFIKSIFIRVTWKIYLPSKFLQMSRIFPCIQRANMGPIWGNFEGDGFSKLLL